MGFNVFQAGLSPSLGTSLADKVVQQLLVSLLTEHLFLTAGQVQHYLRLHAPAGTPAEKLTRDDVNDILKPLSKQGYLGEAKAFLPPVTIGDTPVYSQRRYEPHTTATIEIANLARARLPPLARHSDRKLYFAKEPLRSVLHSLGHNFPNERAEPFNYFARGDAFEFDLMLQRHKEVEEHRERSPYEIACTLLTAHYNLNELRFMDRFRNAIATGACKFAANRDTAGCGIDGSLRGGVFGAIAIFFLRPLLVNQLGGQDGSYRFVCDRENLDECWWL